MHAASRVSQRDTRPRWRTIIRNSFRTIRRQLHRWAWVVIASVAVMAVVLGWLGFRAYHGARGTPTSGFDLIYLTLQLFTLESGAVDGAISWQLQVARFLAPMATASALARACWAVFEQQISELRLRFSRDHVIICGLGNKGIRLVEQLAARGTRVVVIESDDTNPAFTQCRDLGAFVLIGSASDSWLLQKARVDRASVVIAVTGDDGTNVEAAVHAYELSKGRRESPLQCVIHVVDPRLQNHLRRSTLFTSDEDDFRIRIFNVFETAAEAMLEDLYAHQPEDLTIPQHLVIAGFGRLGEAVFLNAMAHLPTFCPRDQQTLHVTVVDRHASSREEQLSLRYPELCRKCELQFIEMETAAPAFERGGFLTDGFPAPTYVCICFDSDAQALTAALVIHDLVREAKVPVVVRMKEDAGLATLVGKTSNGQGVVDGIRAVGMLDLTCTVDRLLE